MEKTGLKLTDRTDAELALLAAGGDQGAFIVMYERYKAGVLSHILGIVRIHEEAEDVMLESFQKAFAQISAYDPSFRFSTWLYKIARNTALDHLDKDNRQNSNMPLSSLDAEVSPEYPSSNDPEADVIRTQELDKTVSLIHGLPELYRDAAKMVLLESYGYQEAAEKLDLPLNTVKTRVRRAREIILSKMEDDDDEL